MKKYRPTATPKIKTDIIRTYIYIDFIFYEVYYDDYMSVTVYNTFGNILFT